jgi:hypothetical protein
MVLPPDKHVSTAIYINGCKWNKVSSSRYLGLIIDDELKWTVHTNHVHESIIKCTNRFYKIRISMPKDVLRTLYYAFVYSYLLDGVEMYANTSPTHLDKLMKLYNKILRILQNRPRLTAMESLYHEYGTLPIYKLQEYQLLLRLYIEMNTCLISLKIILMKTLCSVHIIHVLSLIYTYTTDLHLWITLRSEMPCLKHKAVVLWNNIPDRHKLSDTWAKVKAKWRLIFHHVEFNSIWHQCVISLLPLVISTSSVFHFPQLNKIMITTHKLRKLRKDATQP